MTHLNTVESFSLDDTVTFCWKMASEVGLSLTDGMEMDQISSAVSWDIIILGLHHD